MRKRRWKLVTADESTVLIEPFLDAIIMQDSQGDRCLAYPSSTYESDGFEVFGETDDLFDEFVASKTGPRRRRRGFSTYARRKRKAPDTIVLEITNLV